MVLPLVRVQVAGESRVSRGDLPDTHQAAHLAVIIDGGAYFLVGQITPAVPPDPPDRYDHEGGEHVHQVVVADVVRTVDPVHPLDRRSPPGRRETVPGHLPQQRDRVVVSFLATAD